MHSVKANGLLDQYAAEIQKLPNGSRERGRLSEFKQTITNIQRERARQ